VTFCGIDTDYKDFGMISVAFAAAALLHFSVRQARIKLLKEDASRHDTIRSGLCDSGTNNKFEAQSDVHNDVT
jgi:hypothetical protein